MPIRQRLRRALTRSNLRSDASSSSDSSGKDEPPMPPMKYRRPVDPEHRERLIAFSFATAWRRPSAMSHRTVELSPGNSRLPSRRNSSVPAKSMHTQRGDSTVEKMSDTSSSSNGDIDLSSIGVALTSPYEVHQKDYELKRPKTAPSHRFFRTEPPPFSQAELNRAFRR